MLRMIRKLWVFTLWEWIIYSIYTIHTPIYTYVSIMYAYSTYTIDALIYKHFISLQNPCLQHYTTIISLKLCGEMWNQCNIYAVYSEDQRMYSFLSESGKFKLFSCVCDDKKKKKKSSNMCHSVPATKTIHRIKQHHTNLKNPITVRTTTASLLAFFETRKLKHTISAARTYSLAKYSK